MGNTSSSTKVSNYVNSILGVLNSTTQTAATFASNNQSLTVINAGRGKVNLGDIVWSEYAVVDVQAAQTAIVSAQVQNKINEQIKAMAKSTSQAINANAGSTSSDVVLKNVTDLTTAITNAYAQDCLARTINDQSIVVKNLGNGEVYDHMIKFSEVIKSTSNCVQNNKSVVDASNSLTQLLSATASSTEQFLGDFGWIIGLVIVVLVIVVGGGAAKLLEPKVMMSIACLLCLYFSVASTWEGKPYVRIPKVWTGFSPSSAPSAPGGPPETKAEWEEDKKRNKAILIASVIGTLVTGTMAAVLAIRDNRRSGEFQKTSNPSIKTPVPSE